jgi:hypothetical protein
MKHLGYLQRPYDEKDNIFLIRNKRVYDAAPWKELKCSKLDMAIPAI